MAGEGDPIKEVEAEVQAAQSETDETTALINAKLAQQKGLTRNRVAIVVVWSYVIGLGVMVLYLIYRAIHEDVDAYPDLAEVFKILALPVVTFVIGHYFGSESR